MADGGWRMADHKMDNKSLSLACRGALCESLRDGMSHIRPSLITGCPGYHYSYKRVV